jgi:hypothetical protein
MGRLVALAAATAVCAGGCGADSLAVRRATEEFFAALAARRNDRACARLAPEAADGLRRRGSVCAEEIGRLNLVGGGIRDVRVWGDRAQVVLTGDTVFLTRLAQVWKISAAGCRRRAAGPYDCDVEA